MGLVLLTGGARSGKSVTAVRSASASRKPVTFIATAEPRDEEMRARIERHRADRPANWRVIEEPVEIVDALGSVPADHVVIVDCLTLWVSNLLERGATPEEVRSWADLLGKAAAAREASTFVITNEVGDGIVPADPATRSYRDLMGIVNATIAGAADRVLLVVAGRVLSLGRAEDVVHDLR